MKYKDTVVLVFSKAPEVGKVNTRLIPAIGVEKATQLQDDLIHWRLKSLSQLKLCDVILYGLPDTSSDFFQQCKNKYSIQLANQTGIDLGERMANAIEAQSRNYSKIIVIGTDAPSLSASHIEQTINGLTENTDVVIVPAEDGGYVLIAMKQCHRALFLSVPWGSDRVLTKTRANAIAAGLKVIELETCWDIDRPEDYDRWLKICDGL